MGNKTWMGVVKLHSIWAYVYNSSNWPVLQPFIIYNCGSQLSFYKKDKLAVCTLHGLFETILLLRPVAPTALEKFQTENIPKI